LWRRARKSGHHARHQHGHALSQSGIQEKVGATLFGF
jgi:hypothetical protein